MRLFLSPKVIKKVGISNKAGIYGLFHEFLKDLGHRMLRSQEKSGKSQKFLEL